MESNYLVNDNFQHLDLSILYYLHNEYNNKSKIKKKKLALVNIDDFNQQFFPTIKEKDFRNTIEAMTVRQEIELDSEGMRLTQQGIDKCNKQNTATSV